MFANKLFILGALLLLSFTSTASGASAAVEAIFDNVNKQDTADNSAADDETHNLLRGLAKGGKNGNGNGGGGGDCKADGFRCKDSVQCCDDSICTSKKCTAPPVKTCWAPTEASTCCGANFRYCDNDNETWKCPVCDETATAGCTKSGTPSFCACGLFSCC
jgi:hypothetical protein